MFWTLTSILIKKENPCLWLKTAPTNWWTKYTDCWFLVRPGPLCHLSIFSTTLLNVILTSYSLEQWVGIVVSLKGKAIVGSASHLEIFLFVSEYNHSQLFCGFYYQTEFWSSSLISHVLKSLGSTFCSLSKVQPLKCYRGECILIINVCLIADPCSRFIIRLFPMVPFLHAFC